jgi:hypothetical protein
LHFLCARPATFAGSDVDVGTVPSIVSAIVELLACRTAIAVAFGKKGETLGTVPSQFEDGKSFPFQKRKHLPWPHLGTFSLDYPLFLPQHRGHARSWPMDSKVQYTAVYQ